MIENWFEENVVAVNESGKMDYGKERGEKNCSYVERYRKMLPP